MAGELIARVYYKGPVEGLKHRPPDSPFVYSFPGPNVPAKVSRPEDIVFYEGKEHFEVLTPIDQAIPEPEPQPEEEEPKEVKPVARPMAKKTQKR